MVSVWWPLDPFPDISQSLLGSIREHSLKQWFPMILRLVELWGSLPGKMKRDTHWGGERRKAFILCFLPNVWHSLHLAPLTEFAEPLQLMRNFNSRILNVLFLVPVLRTLYTETQMAFSYLFFKNNLSKLENTLCYYQIAAVPKPPQN